VLAGKEGVKAIEDDPLLFQGARLEFKDFTITWTAARIPRHAGDHVDFGEVGLMAKTYGREDVAMLIERTASAAVGVQASDMCDRASFVGRYVDQGSVLNLGDEYDDLQEHRGRVPL